MTTENVTRFIAEAVPIDLDRIFDFGALVVFSCDECYAMFPWLPHGPRFCPSCGRRNSEAK